MEALSVKEGFLFNFKAMEKKILLFSGGLDSVLLDWKVKPNTLLYVDMKTSYSEAEIRHLERLPSYYTDRLLIKELPIGDYELPDKFLPYRNLLLIGIALQYAPKVYLGLTGQDNSRDCQKPFLKKAISIYKLLSKDNKDRFEWSYKDVGIYAPYHAMTKSEMVKDCLSLGMPPKWIQETRTCYSNSSEKGCGECFPCWNKAVALLNNGLFDKELFDHEISENLFQKSFDFYENTWGKDKFIQPHYKEVVRAYKLLRQE